MHLYIIPFFYIPKILLYLTPNIGAIQFFYVDNVINKRRNVKFLIFGKVIFESTVMYKILFNLADQYTNPSYIL
jgi:hypothetical protein